MDERALGIQIGAIHGNDGLTSILFQNNLLWFFFPKEFWIENILRFVSFNATQVDGSKKGPRPSPVSILLPHELLDALAHTSPFVFESVILGHMNDQDRQLFWQHVSGLPSWSGHPILSRVPFKKLIGIHIHGDGCEFYKEDEFFVWSWSSIFSTKGTVTDLLLFRFPICVIPERFMRKKHVSEFKNWHCFESLVYTNVGVPCKPTCSPLSYTANPKFCRFVTTSTKQLRSSPPGLWRLLEVESGLMRVLGAKRSILDQPVSRSEGLF